jgi:hypothetical protein
MVSAFGSEDHCTEHTVHQVIVYICGTKLQTVHKAKVSPANASIQGVS